MKEYVILRLRLMDGIKVVDFNKKFNANIFDIFNTELTSLKNDNLIIIDKERNNIYLSNRGDFLKIQKIKYTQYFDLNCKKCYSKYHVTLFIAFIAYILIFLLHQDDHFFCHFYSIIIIFCNI